jgi:hypothetical protein
MADESLTTPSAFSRRSLFSVAAAAPVAAATGAPAVLAPLPIPSPVLALLARYRDVGNQLRAADAEYLAAVQGMPEWLRPEAGTPSRPGSDLPAWTRAELTAHHLPDTMPLRPSIQDFRRFNYDLAAAPPELRVDRRKKHLARVALWYRKRRQQQAWFARTGADVVEYRQRALMAVKRDIERELLAVMTGPVGDFARTSPTPNC